MTADGSTVPSAALRRLPVRFWQALAATALALGLAVSFMAVLEHLGHPQPGLRLTEFTVRAPALPDRPAERPSLFNEVYRHSLSDARALHFRADLSAAIGGFKAPTLLITDAFAFIDVRFNGRPVSDQGARDGPMPDRLMEPRIYYLPKVPPGAQAVLDIRIDAAGSLPYMREAFLAERAIAVGAYRSRRFVAIEGVVAATAIAVFAGLLAISVMPLIQRRALASAFSIVMLLWALRNLTYAGPVSDMPWALFQGLYYGSTFLILIATVHLINAWTFDHPLIRRYFAPALSLVMLVLFLAVASGVPGSTAAARQAGNLIGTGCFLLMIGQLTLYAARGREVPWAETFLFLGCLWIGVLELLGDAFPLATYAVFPQTGLSLAYGPLMPLPLAAGMLINFVRQTIRMQKRLQESNALLSTELALRENEIAKVYAQREAEAQESARHLERQRIMQDVHDGIGSQLLGLLLRVRADKLNRTQMISELESSLDDLHLVVESLSQTPGTFEEAIGAFRVRLQAKCEAAGISLQWEIADTASAGQISPAKVLQIYRILQEAASNAIRHGKPRTLTVRTMPEDSGAPRMRIELEDDGQGFDPGAARSQGRGLGNMARRAAAIPASLAIESEPGCTLLRLSVPL